jgi:hypothetical protein
MSGGSTPPSGTTQLAAPPHTSRAGRLNQHPPSPKGTNESPNKSPSWQDRAAFAAAGLTLALRPPPKSSPRHSVLTTSVFAVTGIATFLPSVCAQVTVLYLKNQPASSEPIYFNIYFYAHHAKVRYQPIQITKSQQHKSANPFSSNLFILI